ERILHTVLENADAYGGGATAVVVEPVDGEVRVHVDDDGPGVPHEERERIFDRFARGVHGERRTTADGSGLGLSLARENASALGGRLDVADPPDRRGARFTLALPRAST
ncbi:MAG: sensor histidine kinase, partial [Acidimicrobiia bacterium]